jgi:hypothetical protein
MNEQVFLDFLDANGEIYDAIVHEYPFSFEEFQQWVEDIWSAAGGWRRAGKYAVKDATFETYAVPFERNGKRYWLTLMMGQGDCWTVFSEEPYKEFRMRIASLSKIQPELAALLDGEQKVSVQIRLKNATAYEAIQGFLENPEYIPISGTAHGLLSTVDVQLVANHPDVEHIGVERQASVNELID